VAERNREKVTLICSGVGFATPMTLLKAIALGADGVGIGTAEIVAWAASAAPAAKAEKAARAASPAPTRHMKQMSLEWPRSA